MNSLELFTAYQQLGSALPAKPNFHYRPQPQPNLLALANQYQNFVFDAYGVLNQGDQAIAGAPECLAMLASMNKNLFVLTNSGSLTALELQARFARLGYELRPEQIISSRDALVEGVKAQPEIQTWAAMLPKGASLEGLPPGILETNDADFWQADGFLFMSSLAWDDQWQRRFFEAMLQRPRPVLLGNPDLAAPYQDLFKPQPGHYVLQALLPSMQPLVQAFGKPHQNIFHLLKERMHSLNPWHQDNQTLMIGDTLHTDILGGSLAGFDTLLVTAHGAHQGLDLEQCFDESGIWPTWYAPSI